MKVKLVKGSRTQYFSATPTHNYVVIENSAIRNLGVFVDFFMRKPSSQNLYCMVAQSVGFQMVWVRFWSLFSFCINAHGSRGRLSEWPGCEFIDLEYMPNQRGRQNPLRPQNFFVFSYFVGYALYFNRFLCGISWVHPTIIFYASKSVEMWSLSM